MTGYDVHADKAIKELRARLDQAERERDEARREMDDARAEQRDAEASRDLLVAGYTRAIREWLATHPGDSVPDVVDLFGAVMTERDEARAARAKAEADAAALRATLTDFAERDCDYGDGCPPFGTRHGQCDGCKAREALRATSPAPEPVAAERAVVWGWAGSPDADRWEGMHATREAAIAEARREAGDDHATVWVRRGVKPLASDFAPDASDIIDRMRDFACDNAGEVAEDFPDVSKAARDELEMLLCAWADRHCEVSFWKADGEPECVSGDALAAARKDGAT